MVGAPTIFLAASVRAIPLEIDVGDLRICKSDA